MEKGKVKYAPSGSVAEDVATVAAMTVVRDVLVDALPQARVSSASGGSAHNAVNNHPSHRTDRSPSGAIRSDDLRSGQSRSDATGYSYNGTDRSTEAPH